MQQSLSQFLNFCWQDRILVIKATILLGLIRLGLKFLHLKTLRKCLNKISQSSQKPNRESISIYKIIWSVTTASSYMPQVKCLARALAAKTLLEQQGYSATICIGVAKDQQQTFIAHAWVECKGRVVIGGVGNSINKYQVMSIEDF
ncbi:hypothetical protein Xen7305DRAFT_00022350 [Xenococcus sp. PCC 7305]|uniref:lasso peptide biosynthesis B2 protein n=1 Tax=Xenococcus sp. PCC 7305 TaxID=102125 RepID=UPI0002AC5043|nr:lasso peptide biosynthesis B2 protein [Xenococcus sp. PCC 7305]ELS02521.1 hypothetical protein Xen7305DRAFT_00022350 [Xenococcus sp. PCC 7305]